jgi:hypothetical protein
MRNFFRRQNLFDRVDTAVKIHGEYAALFGRAGLAATLTFTILTALMEARRPGFLVAGVSPFVLAGLIALFMVLSAAGPTPASTRLSWPRRVLVTLSAVVLAGAAALVATAAFSAVPDTRPLFVGLAALTVLLGFAIFSSRK